MERDLPDIIFSCIFKNKLYQDVMAEPTRADKNIAIVFDNFDDLFTAPKEEVNKLINSWLRILDCRDSANINLDSYEKRLLMELKLQKDVATWIRDLKITGV